MDCVMISELVISSKQQRAYQYKGGKSKFRYIADNNIIVSSFNKITHE